MIFPSVIFQPRIGHLLCVHVSCRSEIASLDAMIQVGDLLLTSEALNGGLGQVTVRFIYRYR